VKSHAWLLLAAGLAPIASEVWAQEDETQDAIVVTAQRSGAPIWTIETARGTILLVGEIVAVPKSTPWQPERLEEATARARRVILGTKAKVSPGDILRLIFAGGKITRLPKGTTAADYLDDAQHGRLAALEMRYDQDYSRQSLLMTAFELLTRRLGFNRDSGTDATEVVRRAARRADVPAEPVGTVRGEDILDSLAEAPPESHVPCLEAAMTATERGPDLIEQRGADWRAVGRPGDGRRAARAVDRRDLPRGRYRRGHARRRPAARAGRRRRRARPARAARPEHFRPGLALSAAGVLVAGPSSAAIAYR